jgi:hypothetical protein
MTSAYLIGDVPQLVIPGPRSGTRNPEDLKEAKPLLEELTASS